MGPSGSGKSSIAALLTRMYEPDQGQILIGQEHTALETIPKHRVRKNISYVTQVSRVSMAHVFLLLSSSVAQLKPT